MFAYSGFIWKIAFTVAFFSMVKVHTFVVSSLQGLPVHLTKVEPTPAVGCQGYRSIKDIEFLAITGAVYKSVTTCHRTVAPFLKVVTTLSLLGPWKTALTDFFWSMVTWHTGFMVSQPDGCWFPSKEGGEVRWVCIEGNRQPLVVFLLTYPRTGNQSLR